MVKTLLHPGHLNGGAAVDVGVEVAMSVITLDNPLRDEALP